MNMDRARSSYRQIYISMPIYLSTRTAHLGHEPRQPARPARIESALPQKHSCSRLHPSIDPLRPLHATERRRCAFPRQRCATGVHGHYAWAHVSTRRSPPGTDRRLGRFAWVLARGGAKRTRGMGSLGAKRTSLAPRAMPSALADEALRSAAP